MSEFWFTIGSGVAIGYFIRWAVERIRAECDLLDRRWEEARTAREAVPPRPGSLPFDFDDVSGQGQAGPDELGWPPAPRRRFDNQWPRR